MGDGAGDGGAQAAQHPVEDRAEELMHRVSSDVSRFLVRLTGRAREEFEDIVAEAHTIKNQWGRP
jgi:DNA-directed RNA polymerase specialized sigma24 family protein